MVHLLDIKFIRENPELVKESEKKRFKDPSIVDKVLEYDNKWRKIIKELQKLQKERNEKTKELAKMKKEGREIPENKKIELKKVGEKIKELERKAEEYLKKRDELRYRIGNILHDSVPVGNDEEKDNEVVRIWGKIPEFDFKIKSHADLINILDVADTERAAKVIGSRFYYLKNELVLLNLALIRFGFEHFIKKGHIPLWTPYMISGKAMRGASELADFEETLYGIKNKDAYLIATAEQSILAYHMDEVFLKEELPLKYVGFSTNFRREAGSHGKDTKGIFRVHQFDKVEQIVFCLPEESWDWHEKMIKNAEEIYQALGLPYRVVNICSGEMNDNAAKKYDIEVWFPAQGKYREVVSGSNCTDYQARKLNIKWREKEGAKPKGYVHILNCTGIATERTMCAILENYQKEDGTVEIPKVLRPYMNGISKINPKSEKNGKN